MSRSGRAGETQGWRFDRNNALASAFVTRDRTRNPNPTLVHFNHNVHPAHRLCPIPHWLSSGEGADCPGAPHRVQGCWVCDAQGIRVGRVQGDCCYCFPTGTSTRCITFDSKFRRLSLCSPPPRSKRVFLLSSRGSHHLSQTKDFFSIDMTIKDRLAWQSPESNRGYVRQGRERVTQATSKEEIEALRAKAPDYKETMEIGKDYDSVWPNMWPEDTEAPGFKEFMNSFFETCHKVSLGIFEDRSTVSMHADLVLFRCVVLSQLHVQIMSALALAMGLGEHFFDKMIDQQAHNLRLYVALLSQSSILSGLTL